MLHLERHVARIVRDATLLGLGPLDAGACRAALVAEARRAFPGSEGVVRLEARRGEGGPLLAASARPLGRDPGRWHAVLAPAPHPGPSPWSTAKTGRREPFEAALAVAAAAGAQEAVLIDAGGFVVEGARTSLIVVLASGAAVTPPLSRGPQAGLARALLLERVEGLEEADVPVAALAGARELVAVNAVRGARPVVALGGRPIGTPSGPWLLRLARAFEETS